MMQILIIIIGIAYTCYFLRSLLRERKYVKLRFELFDLRDEILWISTKGHISRETAIHHYNTINWAIRYIEAFPVFFLFGLMIAFHELNLPDSTIDLQKKIDSMPKDLRDWYFRFSTLTIDGMKTYTPLGSALRSPKLFFDLISVWLTLWLFIKMIQFRNHPLSKSVFGPPDFAKAKEEGQKLSETQQKALQLKQILAY